MKNIDKQIEELKKQGLYSVYRNDWEGTAGELLDLLDTAKKEGEDNAYREMCMMPNSITFAIHVQDNDYVDNLRLVKTLDEVQSSGGDLVALMLEEMLLKISRESKVIQKAITKP